MRDFETRVFVGLELTLAVTENLILVQEDVAPILAQRGATVRWIKPHNLHVGLRWIGWVDRSLIPRLRRALRDAVAPWERFEIEADGVDILPSGTRPQLVLARLGSGGDVIERLANAVSTAVESLGIAPETRPFVACALLGRVRTPGEPIDLSDVAEALGHLPLGTSTVTDIVLYESLLSPKGEHYQVLARFPLGR